MVTTRLKLEIEGISIIAFAALLSMLFVVQGNKNRQQVRIVTPLVTQTEPTVTPTPAVNRVMQISPDGTKNVVMKTTRNKDATLTYAFSVANGAGEKENLIYTETLPALQSMSIPFNTWSPDDKYFFIKRGDSDFMVFKESGEPFADGQQFLDVTDLFKQRKTGNNLSEATGWASETLIIINTTVEANAKGPSYWFEIPSKAIIQLATEF